MGWGLPSVDMSTEIEGDGKSKAAAHDVVKGVIRTHRKRPPTTSPTQHSEKRGLLGFRSPEDIAKLLDMSDGIE